MYMYRSICVSSLFVGLSDTEGEEESCVSEEDEGTVDSHEEAEEEEGLEGVESNRGDEWEEEKEDEDDHDDLEILAVSEEKKTGKQEYFKSTLISFFFFGILFFTAEKSVIY